MLIKKIRRRRTLNRAVPVLFFLCLLQSAVAQPPHRFTHFTTNDGLAQNMVVCMHLDSRGFLWFGTKNGLSRYDGYEFHNYENDPSDSTSITGGVITAIHESSNGDLWIGSADGSIDIFHRADERFEHLTSLPSYPSGLRGAGIYQIVEDASHRHWYPVSGKGLMEVDDSPPARSASGAGHRFTLHGEMTIEGRPFDCKRIRSIYADRSGGLWLQADSGIVVANRPIPAPVRIQTPQASNYDYLGPHWEILEDRNGTMWFAYRDLLVSLDVSTGKMERYPLTVSRPPIGWTSDIMVQRDREGSFVIVSNGSIHRFDPRTPDRQTSIAVPEEAARWTTPIYFQSATLDSSGNLWLGTQGYGLYRYSARSNRFGFVPDISWWQAVRKTVDDLGFPPRSDPKTLPYPFSRLYWSHVVREPSGREWMLENVHGDGPVLSFDSRTGERRRYPLPLLDKVGAGTWYGNVPGLSLSSAEDDAGYFWIGQSIIRKFDTHSGRVMELGISRDRLVPADSLEPDQAAVVLTTAKDRDGTLWFGTLNRGIYHLDPRTRTLKNFSYDPNDPLSLSRNHVLTLREDPFDPDNYLWAGTDGGGLNRLDKRTGRCLRLSVRDGLPDDVVYAIMADKRGFLWISTNQGLSRLDPRSMNFRNYDISDGLTAMEFNRNEYFQDFAGTMYFGNVQGINIFNPGEIVDNPHVPPLALTDLRLKNISVSVRDSASFLTSPISETRELRLPDDQNIITLEYAALDFANPGKNLYSHMLEGFEKEWSPPSTRRTATYTNLDPGTYTFRVRGSNCDGVWNMAGTSLTIIILPPWYRTVWAYVSYVVLLLSGLLVFRRYDLRRIRLKDQLDLEQALTAQLREVDQLKMRFFQNVSHEFRTPLTLILGPVEKLLDNIQDQSAKRELRVVKRNAQRLLGLINQILDISKLEAGGMKLRASRSDLVPFVRGVTMAFHSLAERKGIFLDVQTTLPSLELYFDHDKLEKVLVNLLGNAFKFTPESGEIIVSLSSTAGEAVIVVRDTGIGISKDRLPHIFDRFYQVDSSTTRSAEGTGIGLSLVKDFVELHHGRVEVTSEPGKGAEFIVHLRLGSTHLTPQEIAAGAPLSAVDRVVEVESDNVAHDQVREHEANETGKPIILIVEDNADVLAYVRSCLTSAYAVSEARDGAEGFVAASQLIPDLVISDVMMPKMDGYELCSRLKRDEKTSHIPVILLTAKAAMEDKIGGLETGADDYLVKPFDAGELLVRVRNLIELRRKLREKFGKELVALKPDEVKVTPIEDAFIRKVLDAIEAKLGDENFNVEDLSAAVGMSYTQLHRKLKAITNQSAAQFIRTIRLKRAMDLLLQGAGTVSEIAYSVGFGSPAYFTKCFQDEFGTSPSDVRKQP